MNLFNPSHVRHGSNVGQPLTRRDGLVKVTGAARFAADNNPVGMLHAVMATSTIARGRVTSLDIEAAKSHPGVVDIITPANVPRLAFDPDEKTGPFDFKIDALQSDTVRYANQPIAVVIAESLEAAAEGNALLNAAYETEKPAVLLDNGPDYSPPIVGFGLPAKVSDGDIDSGLTMAASRIEVVYETPVQYHNPLEPHAIVAQWNGDFLTLDTPSQGMGLAKIRLSTLFGIPADNIFIRSSFLGGGFGCKGFILGPQVLGIIAARLVNRPVKLVLLRNQMFGPVGRRSMTRQKLRLGAAADGALMALDHHTVTETSRFDDFYEPAGRGTHALYTSTARSTSHSAVRLDMGTPLPMRAPGEAPGSAAIECALDEMAEVCGMDPLDFRLKNYAEVEPISGKPFTSKNLKECYALGAARFGWAGRPLAPRMMRDPEGLLTGWGMGTANFPANMFQAEAKVQIRADGATIEIGTHEMGQGAATALAQIAAEGLGLDIDQIDFRSGKSDLPDGGIAGGSTQTATAGSAIHNAIEAAIAALAGLAVNDASSPLFAAGNAGFIIRDGYLWRRDHENRGESYGAILDRAGRKSVEGKGKAAADPALQANYAAYSHGAVFAEVKVDPDLGQLRVSRLVGAFAAGRIINPRLVESQYLGGMIWGVSFALYEKTTIDSRTGRTMNANLGEYYIPVNADIPSMEAIIVDEHDPYVNALGVKGVGEIGITGTVGAIANAVYHATGIRVRSFPITLDKLIV